MKKVLMLLLAGTLLSSCKKDSLQHDQSSIVPVGTTLTLALSGSISEEEPPKEGTRSVDIYLDSDKKIKATLKGRSTVRVKTYVYGDRLRQNLAWSGVLPWKVLDEGTRLSYEGPVTLSGTINSNEVTLVAILDPGNTPITEAPTVSPQANLVPIESSNGDDKITLDIPYAMEASLQIRNAGQANEKLTNSFYPPRLRKFRPYGYFLRIEMENTTNTPVTVKGLYASGYGSGYSLKPSNLAQGMLPKNISEQSGRMYFPLSSDITIPANQTSPKSLLFWSGTSLSTINPDLHCEGSPLFGYYTSFTRKAAIYRNGSAYRTLFKIRELKNPLSYFAEGPVSTSGASFASTDVRPPRSMEFIGRFSRRQAMGEVDNSDLDPENFYPRYRNYTTFRGITGYKLPSIGNWKSIHPGITSSYPAETYQPGQVGEYIYYDGEEGGLYPKMEVGNVTLWGMTAEALRPKIPEDRGVPLVRTNSFVSYALGYIDTTIDIPSLRRTKHYRRCFAFRYRWRAHPDYQEIVECKYVGSSITSVRQLKDKPNGFWSGAEYRVFPSVPYGTKHGYDPNSPYPDKRLRSELYTGNKYWVSDVPFPTQTGQATGAYSTDVASIWLYKTNN